MKRQASGFVARVFLALLVSSSALADEWRALRSFELELYPQAADQLRVHWHPVWQADANDEELYLIDRWGKLADKVQVSAWQTSGTHAFTLHADEGPYRLVVPGYSFRSYRVIHDNKTKALLNPGKLHVVGDISAGTRLFFRVPANAHVELGGKNHGGANALKAIRMSDGKQLKMPLIAYRHYHEFDLQAVPVSGVDEIWQLTIPESGKVSFWLDGTDNLFAQDPDAFQGQPVASSVNTDIELTGTLVGPVPRLGVAVPYIVPPESTHEQLKKLALQSVSHYSFVDAIGNPDRRELGIRDVYSRNLGVGETVTLLAGTGRRAVLQANAEARTGLEHWVNDTLQLGPGGPHYLSFADEPNLNYPSQSGFEQYFTEMLEHLYAIPGVAGSSIRVAAPASARWINGPFRRGSAERRGIDWARSLLEKHGARIDALAWHEWMVRSLYATGQYRTGIQAAADLVGRDQAGRPRKALLIDQTNISSGNTVSPYEQDTNYAALWWASVIINSSTDGLLDVLNWFHLVDEPDHLKGLFKVENERELRIKQVGLLHGMFSRKWGGNVYRVNNESFEVDVLHTQDKGRHRLFGVNKSARNHLLRIKNMDECPDTSGLQVLHQSGGPETWDFSCSSETVEYALPPESMFVLEWHE